MTIGEAEVLVYSVHTETVWLGPQKRQEQIETFQAMPATDPVFLTAGQFPDPGGPITPDTTGDDLTSFQRSYTITPNQPAIGLTTVTVTVNCSS